MFVGTKKVLAIICAMKEYSRVKRQTDRAERYNCKKECNKWLNKVGTFAQGSKGWKKIKRTAYQNSDDVQNLLIKLTVKARSEKA